MPPTSPQNGAPTPTMVIPEAVVTKVRMAGSLASSMASEAASAVARLEKRASPATA